MDTNRNAPVRQNPPPPEWLPPLMRSLGSVNGTPSLPERITITPAQVAEIEHRVSIYRQRLATDTSENDDKAKAILMLFAVLASEPMPADFAALRQLAYLESVASVPAWAVREAARIWRDGERLAEGENRNFVPKPAELMRIVNLLLAPHKRALGELQNLLTAAQDRVNASPRLTERENVAEGFAVLRSEIDKRPSAHQIYEDAMAGLQRRARDNGVDFEAAMNAIPDRKP